MKRNRLLVLSTLALVTSGALIFACSDNGGESDAGTDSGGADAKGDATKSDASSDVKTNDVTTSDVTTSDVTTSDVATDAPDDGSVSDAGMTDGGPVSTFMVVRLNGTADAGADAAPTSTSTPVFLEERNISDGSLVRVIPMPTAMSGNNQPFTMSGSASSEGQLTTSVDGHTVVLTGFAAAPGVTKIASTSTDGGAMRVVARVDSAGNVDTTTELATFDGFDIRAAATVDGGSFWAVGAGAADAGGNAGVQYVMIGSTGASTNILSVPANTRTVGVYGGQLYMGTSFTPNNGINMVGTGVPTTGGQTATLLPGFAGDAGSPYGFSMMDLDASVTGVDTLYVADDSSQGNGGGIQKWVFNGTTWTKIATFTNGTTTGFRGVMATQGTGGVVVIGTTTETNGNSIVKYLDDGQNTNPTGTVIATAPTNTVFRGIALAPAP